MQIYSLSYTVVVKISEIYLKFVQWFSTDMKSDDERVQIFNTEAVIPATIA